MLKINYKKLFYIAFVTVVILIAISLFLIFNGIILLNNPSESTYPIRGVDVSSYQGFIDWKILSGQGIEFAFIKATEGSSYVDPNFTYNFKSAAETSLRIGAYHFFSFDSSGEAQANNYISAVPKTDNMLPPVVDIEFYGDKKKNPNNKESTQNEILILLQKLESYYNMTPIIYATEESYNLYISGDFDKYDIWIRNVISKPTLSDNRFWTFWQYTNREKLDGYNGKEKYIDMNVFNGTAEEFDHYPVR